ncbi:P-loop containing nucleoside triphosphate hydrolase protein [Corynespora cassiicola Philippines]|uniref:P-loop containing nucleoside triphosphate hydrolase protein n=1 Tax=Corynespora cassiicola Philippines TaxID=1448308 RepID=A0A2T2NQB6_CORCC|nr:P-loop containing nucleoside triphosphate hydrolase protein [Corynespora cassiicola Philippines]
MGWYYDNLNDNLDIEQIDDVLWDEDHQARDEDPFRMPGDESFWKGQQTKKEKHSSPGTLQSWVVGILSGGDEVWLQAYLDSPMFELARESLRSSSGLDMRWLVAGYIAYRTGAKTIPFMYNLIKSYGTSSVTIDARETWTCKAVLEFCSRYQPSWVSGASIFGRHEVLRGTGQYEPKPLGIKTFLWHEKTLMMVESLCAFKDNADEEGKQGSKSYGRMHIRCFGSSDEPIKKFIEASVQYKRSNRWLDITIITAGADGNTAETKKSRKRPLSTMDLDPELVNDVQNDIEEYFHESSQKFYESAGTSYRRGYLFHGPPGSGKTSLSVALASHVNVPLVIIKPQDMNDADLELAFDSLPERCIALLEDIDCASIDTNRTSSRPSAKPEGDSQVICYDEVADMIKFALEQQTHADNSRKLGPKNRKNSDESNSKEKKLAPSPQLGSVAPKKITLSGLLNVIDGAGAKEGRLVIFTTNAPKSLDPALYRAGRVDRRFGIGFCTKATVEMTFRRIFASDPRSQFTTVAIDRFAKGFAAQFPSKSKITTAFLANYCAGYRKQPDKAVQEFAGWLRKFKSGQDAFEYDINDDVPEDDGDIFDEIEPLDHSLYQLRLEDYQVERIKATTMEDALGASNSWLEYVNRLLFTPKRVEGVHDTNLLYARFCDVSLPEIRSTDSGQISGQGKDKISLLHNFPFTSFESRT